MRSWQGSLLVVVLTAISLVGCAHEDDSRRSNSSSGAPPGDCFVPVDSPANFILDMGAVSAHLPMADIDIQFHQSERVLISGGGKCSPTVPREVAEKCRLVTGSIDSLDPDYESVMLWRSGQEMAEYVFAGGAKKLTFEGVTAYAQAESLTAYKYRVWLIEYPSRTGVEQSNIWSLADECSASVDTESERGLPVVHSDGTRLVVVEPWIAEIEDPDGGDQMPSGVLSEAALEFVADEVLELADA